MTVPAPETITPLGASTLIRDWRFEIDTSATASPEWTPVRGRTDFKPSLDSTLQDDSDFDSEGYKSETKTAEAWALECKVARKVAPGATAVYDPGQEALRLAAEEMGPANTVHVRWYKMGAVRVEAYEGYAAVSYEPEGGEMDALDMAAFKLTGQGKRLAIAHPKPA